jgi:hypothetical protein
MIKWSPELVLEHLLAIMSANDVRYSEKFISQEKAISIAEMNAEKWRSNANEWRAAMGDREVKFATQAEMDIQFAALRDRLNKLELAKATTEGKFSGISGSWAVLISVVAGAIAIVNILWQFK